MPRLQDSQRSGLAVVAAVALVGAALAMTECSGALPASATSTHDVPIPAGEPRAELRLRVDLDPAQRCEEAFDLALYADRAVDLIQWDRGGACAGRVVTIRYLPGKIAEGKLLAAARALSAKAEVLPAEAGGGQPGKPGGEDARPEDR